MSDKGHTFSVSPAGIAEMLTGGGEFVPPARMLGDLTEAQALAVPPGSPYSIAVLVAHMGYWQNRNIERACGLKEPRPEHLDDTFPTVQPGEWAALRENFLTGLEVCAEMAVQFGGGASPDREDADMAFDLAMCPAFHSAYHYGQIAMLRQIQGLWPPEGGDDSW